MDASLVLQPLVLSVFLRSSSVAASISARVAPFLARPFLGILARPLIFDAWYGESVRNGIRLYDTHNVFCKLVVILKGLRRFRA